MMSETEKEIDDFLKIFGTSLRHYTLGDIKQRAITAWNTRTPDPRVKKLEEALEPMAQIAEWDISDDEHDDDLYKPMSSRAAVGGLLKIGDFRRARQALGE